MKATLEFIAEVNSIKGLRIVGEPKFCNVAIQATDKKINIYSVGNYVSKQGFHMQAGPVYPVLMIIIHHNNALHLKKVAQFLRDGVEAVRKSPKEWEKGPMKINEVVSTIPRAVGKRVVQECFHELYRLENYE